MRAGAEEIVGIVGCTDHALAPRVADPRQLARQVHDDGRASHRPGDVSCGSLGDLYDGLATLPHLNPDDEAGELWTALGLVEAPALGNLPSCSFIAEARRRARPTFPSFLVVNTRLGTARPCVFRLGAGRVSPRGALLPSGPRHSTASSRQGLAFA